MKRVDVYADSVGRMLPVYQLGDRRFSLVKGNFYLIRHIPAFPNERCSDCAYEYRDDEAVCEACNCRYMMDQDFVLFNPKEEN